MRKSVAIYGATEEALALVPLLEESPELEVVAIYDPDLEGARKRLEELGGEAAERLRGRLTHERERLLRGELHAVVDAGIEPPFGRLLPDAAARGVQIVSPLTARLLWGYGVSARDRKQELLQALHEVVESVNLTVDPDELFQRMLEIAMGVTGADGGSLMLLDGEEGTLRIRVAVGVEPELWPKIRVPLGEGIAGRVAQEGRPIHLRGRADRERFRIVRERMDVESALCVPLAYDGSVLGVLNLHHSTRPEAFGEADLHFVQQLGRLDAQIIARAQEHEALRSRATRYDAVREVRSALAGTAPLLERLGALCRRVAARAGGGIATVYLFEPDEGELRLAATSLEGGGFGGEYRVRPGQGVDGRAAQTRRPVFLEGEGGSLGYAALPLLAGDQLVGVLSVQGGAASGDEEDAPRGRALRETLVEASAAVAEEVAQSEREGRMATRATKASALNEAGLRLVSARDVNEAARLATASAALVLEADHAVLRLRDPETRRYVIRSYYGSADGRLQERLFRLDKRVAIAVIKTRQPRRVRHLEEEEPTWSAEATELRSVLAAPLKREGRVIGTLALYDKVAPDQFYTGAFNEDDLQIFTRYVSYVERSLANALTWARTREAGHVDEETGLPNADALARRVDQEIARAGGREGAFALLTCRAENEAEIRAAGEGTAERLLPRLAASLRGQLRDFDVLARTGAAELTALLPEPGGTPGDRVARIARSVADEVAKDERLNRAVRVALAFGYAVHPAEGEDRASLLERAAAPRIRTV